MFNLSRIVALYPPGPWQRVTWVDAGLGSNTTGQIGRPDKPFATIKAAHDACVSATGAWLVKVQPGTYTDVGMTSELVSYYFEPGANLNQVSGSTDCFNITGTTSENWGIYGFGTFTINSAGTGRILYFGGTVNALTFEGSALNVVSTGMTGNTGAAHFYGSTTGPQNSYIKIDFAQCASSSQDSLYIRGGGKYMITGGLFTAVTLDGGVDVKAIVNEAHKWVVGKNNFAQADLRLTTNRGLKGSDGGPALKVRTGNVVVHGGCVYSGGGAPSSSQATILEINSQSNGEAANVNVMFVGSTLVNWGNGASSALSSGNGPMIRYPAYSGAKVTLVGCHMVSGTINATVAMVTSTSSVAQNLYIGGGGTTSNVAVSGDITTVGSSFTVNASFPDVINFP